MSQCDNNCSSCSDSGQCEIEKEKTNDLNNVKHVIAVMSGKGGVGKSTVTSLLATAYRRKGYKVGVLDADITGPSIPKLFGVKGKLETTEFGILPMKSKNSIEIMSINLLLANEDEPVIWRGPIISGAIKQFWEEVIWGDLDYLFVDLPPGTGDAPLTVMQTLPVDGVVIVTSPQDLAGMVVRKAMKMANKMDIPILGIVENMSYLECPSCSEKIYPFGEGKTEQIAKDFNIPVLGVLPIESSISTQGDQGLIEASTSVEYLNIDMLEEKLS